MSTRRTPNSRPAGLGRGLGELFARTEGEPRPAVPREGSHIVDVATRDSVHPMPEGSRLLELPPSAIDRLADLYEAALFSGQRLPERARDEAIRCLDDLLAAVHDRQ